MVGLSEVKSKEGGIVSTSTVGYRQLKCPTEGPVSSAVVSSNIKCPYSLLFLLFINELHNFNAYLGVFVG